MFQKREQGSNGCLFSTLILIKWTTHIQRIHDVLAQVMLNTHYFDALKIIIISSSIYRLLKKFCLFEGYKAPKKVCLSVDFTELSFLFIFCDGFFGALSLKCSTFCSYSLSLSSLLELQKCSVHIILFHFDKDGVPSVKIIDNLAIKLANIKGKSYWN